MQLIYGVSAAVAAMLFSFEASAHITLEVGQATAGSNYKAVFRVSHGCENSPTVRVRMQIPDGVVDVKPQPKPGWKVSTTKGKLSVPHDDGKGGKITEGIREVVWAGGSLPNDQYDEFWMRVRLPNTPNATIYFPVVQECAKGVTRWIEIPQAGKTLDDYKEPAAALKLVPKQ